MICALVLSTAVLIEGSSPQKAFAQTSRVDELKQSISSREDEIKKIEQEIAEYQTRLTVVGGQKKTLQTAIQKYSFDAKKNRAHYRNH